MEQRRTLRFQLQLPLSITRSGAERVTLAGLTNNISSSGVRFAAKKEPDLGGPIEYVIALNREGPQADSLRPFAVQRNHVLDGPTQIRLFFRREPNSAGTNVVGQTSEGHAFGAGTRNRERKLELETQCSSLFHVSVIKMLGVIHAQVNRTSLVESN